MIKYIELKTAKYTYLVIRDKPIKGKLLTGFTVYDSSEKNVLYRLKISSSDIDTIILVDYPAKNVVANLEGEWTPDIFNVTFSVYDYKLNKWIDGTMKRTSTLFTKKYSIEWNNTTFVLKNKFLSSATHLYNKEQNELFGKFKMRGLWMNWFRIKYDLYIYSDKLPNAIYFFALAIKDHLMAMEGKDD